MQNSPEMSPEGASPDATEANATADAANAAVNSADTSAETERIERVPSLEEQLRGLELKAAEHYDAWLRAKAETENVRRRAQDDIAKAGKYAVDKFAQSLLPVKDSLEATLVAESATLENLKAGVELTLKQLAAAFQSAGISDLDPLGEKFDPHRHQAISVLESEGDANRVINVLQKGYLLHDRVLRPAMVIVSKAKEGSSQS